MSATTGNDALSGSNGNDVIDLFAGNDSYLGLDGNDSILGNDGADTIYGGNGDDSIAGGNGDDRIFGEAGNDSIDAGAGTFDRILYNQTGGEAITATINAVGGSSGYNAATVTTASQGNDSVANVEQITGSVNNDSFTVNGAATASTLLYIFGGTGNDTITMNVASGGVLADYNAASGNAGFTRGVLVDLAAGHATDYAGTDQLINVRGVNGSALNDTILGGANDDRFREQGGSDSIDGRGGSDMLDYSGNGSSQSVSVNLATGFANDGRGGTDTIISMEFVRGGSGNDTIIGNTADNELRGGSGADILDGGASGFDVADYANNASSQAISVNLTAGLANDGLGGTDTLSSIEYIRGGSGNDTLIGSDANERFRGNAGNDSIDGGNGTEDILDLSPTSVAVSASLVTGMANDGLGGTDVFTGIEIIYAGTAADTLIGSAGNEIFDGGMGGDLIDGGLGADRVRYYVVNGNNSSVTRGVSVDLAVQRATDGWGGQDTLIGIERVAATNFNDTLLGDNASNRFSGLAGSDSIDGGLASDFLEYSDNSATSGVTVNLTTGTASDGRGGTDSFTSIENVFGGSFADHLTGIAQLGRATSRLRGGGGSDTLVGIEGQFVVADYADQTMALSINLASGLVNDSLGGVDSLVNIRGTAMFGNYADTLIGTAANEWFSPSGGNDTIVGGDGFDILSYGGNPTRGVSVNLATGTAFDDDGGTDFFTGIEGILVEYSNDTVNGNDAGNLIGLGAGADFADAAGGQDTISYSLGATPNTQVYITNESDDRLPFGGVTIDLAAGRASGTDTILNFEAAIGSTMHDSILGSNGNEIFDGAERNDTINAGGGDDTIVGGDGNDLFMGGAGNDLYLMAAATGNVTINDASGNDTVSFGGGSGREILASEISSVAGIEAYDLANGGNTLHLTAARAISASGTGLFRVFGGGADRIIFDDTGWVRTGSSGGFDTFSNSAGNATVIASSGLVSSETGTVVNGGDGNDTIPAGNGSDTIDGGNGNDLIGAFGGNDTILGGSGDDSIDGGNGADTVLGGQGNDQIQGGNGNDSLSGGDGDDTLNGGGEDTLMGGAGNDLYVAGSTSLPLRINDSGGSDTLSFQGATLGSISAAALGSVNGIEAINLAGGGNTLNLSASRVAALSDTDLLRVFGSGSDRLVFDDAASWTGGTPSAGFVTFTSGSATVIAAESLVSVVSGPTPGNDTLTGTAGNDVIDLFAGNDSYLGLDGNDTIAGNDGADTIYGGNGADSIVGGNGDDRIFGEAGNDSIDAGAGNSDRISFNQTGGEAITAIITSSGGSAGDNSATVTTATQGTDNIRGFEFLSASSDADLITVTTAATQINNLFLFGGSGNDTIIENYRLGGVFADYNTTSTSLTSGISVDLTSGNAADGLGGTDSLVGITAVNGTSLADTMLGSGSNDRFRGLQGNDLMDGRGGAGDLVEYSGNSASQAVSVNLATGRANDGLGGTDTLISIEQVRGGAGNDVLIGDSNNNTFRGNGGSDTIDGAGGTFDTSDYAFATAAVSVNLVTGQAQDGQGGVDSLAGIEVVLGSTYGDMLIGGSGNDNLRGNAGNDTLDGGAGTADVAQYTSATTGITVNLDTGIVQDGQGGTDSLAGIEQIWGSSFNDSMLGGNGADFFVGSTGADTFDGGLGVDAVSYSFYPSASSSPTQGVSVDLATGTARDAFGGVDRLFGIEIIEGSSFADTITGGAANEVIRGNGGADSLSGGAGNDWISGSTGNERLQGGAGSDTIDAGSGDDTLWGNLGQDTYVGGAGSDLFFLTHQENFASGDVGSSVSAQDVVQDFNRLEGDKLGLFGGFYQDVSGTNRTLAWYGTIGDANAVVSLSAGVALPDGASSDQVRAYWLPRVGGDGWLALDLNRDGVLNTSDFAVFVNTSDNAALVVNDFATGTFVSGSVNNNDTINGTGNAETFDGGVGNDLLNGLAGNDCLIGGSGDDSLSGGDGNDTLSGDAGNDVAIYSDARTAYRFSLDDGALIVTGPTGTDRLQGIESLRFGSDAPIEVSSLGSMNLIEETVAVSRGGVTTAVLAERYSGPVEWLEYQMLGIDGGDVMSGTSRNDFFNLLGGDDAANGGGGDDVLDGGSGSNFLTGGTGRDDFFLDGRGGTVTWATITDWQANERLSVWGWRPGVSTAQWVDNAGAIGYTGVTMHGDLDGNGVIDTSVTWTGMTAAQLPTPLEYEGLLWFT